MNSQLWKSISDFVELSEYPKLPCPFCHEVELTIDENSVQSRALSKNYEKSAPSRHFQSVKNKLSQEILEQKNTIKEMYDENKLLGVLLGAGLVFTRLNQPNYEFHKFIAFMSCQSCGDNVAVNGLAQIHNKTRQDQVQLVPIYKIEHFSTPIPLFKIDSSVPTKIQLELLGAFSYFHIDTNSSANKLRRAIEHFCRELNGGNAKLAHQIQKLKKTYPLEADLLDTLRLVGNEGTHSDGVDEDDLLTAFRIFEEVLTIFKKQEILNEMKLNQKVLTDKFDKKMLTDENVVSTQ